MYKYRVMWYDGFTNLGRNPMILDTIQSTDPIFLLAIPALLAQGWYQQRRRELARAAAMQRHPSARRN